MNDITKARFFLKNRQSDMQHLTSFGLMLATAEQRYRDIRLRQKGNRELPGALDVKEVEAAVDYAVLKYLKKHNRLPSNIGIILEQGTTLDEKKALAQQWSTS
jgi:hypothetical protein